MHGIDIVLIAIALILAGAGAYRAYGIARGKRDCCSGDAEQSRVSFKKTDVDRNPEHYVHHATLTIQGMTCENCVKHVRGALESLGDTFVDEAQVGEVSVLTNREVAKESFAQVIYDAGYRLVDVREKVLKSLC